jgi:outer membrane protein assembly factor BamB
VPAARAVGPLPVPGWPVGAAGSTTFVAADGTVVSSGLSTAAYTLGGRKLWQDNDRSGCGNCYADATPMLSAAGVVGPIGFGGGDHIWALDLAGRDVVPCPGVTGPDNDCYSLDRDPQGTALLRRTGSVAWTYTDAAMPTLYEYLQPLARDQVAFVGDVVAIQISAGVDSQVVALDRATGRLLWRYGPLDPYVRSVVAGPAALPDGTLLLFTRRNSSNDTVVVALTLRAPSGGAPPSPASREGSSPTRAAARPTWASTGPRRP